MPSVRRRYCRCPSRLWPKGSYSGPSRHSSGDRQPPSWVQGRVSAAAKGSRGCVHRERSGQPLPLKDSTISTRRERGNGWPGNHFCRASSVMVIANSSSSSITYPTTSRLSPTICSPTRDARVIVAGSSPYCSQVISSTRRSTYSTSQQAGVSISCRRVVSDMAYSPHPPTPSPTGGEGEPDLTFSIPSQACSCRVGLAPLDPPYALR